MRNNSIFTYVLYSLIALLVLLAGYKACQMKAEYASEQKKKDAYLDETIKNVPYIDPDSTVRNSAFVSDSSAGTLADANGIESDKPVSGSKKTTTGNQTNSVKPAPAKQTAPAPVTEKPKTAAPPPVVAKPKTAPPAEQAPVSSGKFMVITGAFKSVENARDEMEALVKMGYQNAEVKSLAAGYYHAIATRTNDKTTAQKTADALKAKGFAKAYVRGSK